MVYGHALKPYWYIDEFKCQLSRAYKIHLSNQRKSPKPSTAHM